MGGVKREVRVSQFKLLRTRTSDATSDITHQSNSTIDIPLFRHAPAESKS